MTFLKAKSDKWQLICTQLIPIRATISHPLEKDSATFFKMTNPNYEAKTWEGKVTLLTHKNIYIISDNCKYKSKEKWVGLPLILLLMPAPGLCYCSSAFRNFAAPFNGGLFLSLIKVDLD